MQTSSEITSSEQSSSGNCKNCETPLPSQALYCYHCGQKDKERLTFKTLITDIATTYAGFDGIFIKTIKGMLLKPGLTVREYLAGKQKPYLKPVQYYLLTLGFYFLIAYSFNVDPMEYGNKINKLFGLPTTEQQTLNDSKGKQMAKVFGYFRENMKVVFTLLIPVFALSLWICYRKSNYNYLEYMVLALYIYGTNYLLFSFQSIFIYVSQKIEFWGIIITIVMSLCYVFYVIWGTYQFFTIKGIKGWIFAIACYAMTTCFYMLFVGILAIPIGIFVNLYS